MIGKTTIQLFDKKSGKLIKQVVDKNLVTNLYKNMLEDFFKLPQLSSCYMNNVSPLVNNTISEFFGGLLLLDSQQPEDPDEPYLSNGDIIGHAYDTTADTSPYIGTLNQAESGEIVNVGYRWVWDFATDRANGSIRCVCLTNPQFGKFAKSSIIWSTGNGSGNYIWPTISGFRTDWAGIGSYGDVGDYNLMTGNNDDYLIGGVTGKLYFQRNSSGTVEIHVIDHNHLSSISYNESAFAASRALYTLQLDANDQIFFGYIGGVLYALFYDDSAATWYLRIYDIADFSTVISSVALDTSTISLRVKDWAVFQGYLWCADTTNDKIHKYNMSTGSLIESVDVPMLAANTYVAFRNMSHKCGIISTVHDTGSYDTLAFAMFNGDIYNALACVMSIYDDYCDHMVASKLTENGEVLYIKHEGSTSHRYYQNIILNPFTLATINNLATPVVKDNTQTMKVTYEITW